MSGLAEADAAAAPAEEEQAAEKEDEFKTDEERIEYLRAHGITVDLSPSEQAKVTKKGPVAPDQVDPGG